MVELEVGRVRDREGVGRWWRGIVEVTFGGRSDTGDEREGVDGGRRRGEGESCCS